MRLNIGCGNQILDGWVNIDKYYKHKSIVKMDASKLEYPDNSVDEILAHMVLEHIPRNQTVPTLKEWYRVLKLEGKITIATIDLDGLCRDWLNKDGGVIIDGKGYDYTYNLRGFYGQQLKGHFHYTGFDFPYLHKLMTEAGYRNIECLPTNHSHHLYVEARK